MVVIDDQCQSMVVNACHWLSKRKNHLNVIKLNKL